MKKIALATLLAASAVIASAQVTVSGKIGEYMDSTKTGANTVNGIVAEKTSNITIRAIEDLGNGLQARVVVDTKIAANDPTATGNTTQLGDRQSTLGLANRLGSIDLGRSYHSVFNTIAANDAFGAFYGTIAKDIHSYRDTRFSNGVYITANPISNGKVTYERALNNVGGPDVAAYSFGGTVGSVTATLARYEAGVDVSTVLGAGTTLGTTKLNVIYSDNTGVSSFKGTSVSAIQPLAGTSFSLKGSYGQRTGDIKAYNMGVDYAFSKTTVASVIYRNVNAPGGASDIKEMGVGLLMKF
jgi:predicted porin